MMLTYLRTTALAFKFVDADVVLNFLLVVIVKTLTARLIPSLELVLGIEALRLKLELILELIIALI